MAYDRFRPPEHFSPKGKFLYRAMLMVLFILIMSAFAYFVVPLIQTYVSFPAGDWVYEQLRQWTGEPPRPPRG
jgi:hypothetical protein